ncbi:glycosyl hydrolase family 32 [Amycolatopsis sp. NBC_00345]|uniref:glycosyl hydrolase family 32 n=1 Tax=Amycolatopsis sp. NBC_00345 TaxID=2975955 RepID=UPI002E267544
MEVNRRTALAGCLALGVTLGLAGTGSAAEADLTVGTFAKIYDPSVGESGPWYLNDHTFIRDLDGTWHVFGITHAEPADPDNEISFAHATAPDLHGPWTKQPFALTVDPAYGETHLWAPHVIRVGATYHMFYCGGGAESAVSAINLATSKDLFHWTRDPGGTLFHDGYDARDPYVIRIDGRWVLFYTGNTEPSGGNHVVLYRTSHDLRHWSDRDIAYVSPESGTWGGPTESPFVLRHGRYWYLFTGPRLGYAGTDVHRSDSPFHFDNADLVTHFPAHAAEVVRDHTGWYASHAGWGQGGLYLAPITWARPGGPADTPAGDDVGT